MGEFLNICFMEYNAANSIGLNDDDFCVVQKVNKPAVGNWGILFLLQTVMIGEYAACLSRYQQPTGRHGSFFNVWAMIPTTPSPKFAPSFLLVGRDRFGTSGSVALLRSLDGRTPQEICLFPFRGPGSFCGALETVQQLFLV